MKDDQDFVKLYIIDSLVAFSKVFSSNVQVHLEATFLIILSKETQQPDHSLPQTACRGSFMEN